MRIFYIIIVLQIKLYQFYFVFIQMEVTCIAAGLGYNDLENCKEEVSHLPKGYHGQWDRICGAKAIEMETSVNPAECIKFFNCSTVLYIM